MMDKLLETDLSHCIGYGEIGDNDSKDSTLRNKTNSMLSSW